MEMMNGRNYVGHFVRVVLLFGAALLGAPANARAEVKVVTTLPHLADIAKTVGGEGVAVTALLSGAADPHFIDPTPRLMADVAQADLFVEIGLQLEIWTERVIEGAANPRIKPGRPGHVYASDNVPRLDVPSVLSRSQGDLHPDGNPHIWLDPLNAKIEAANIAEGLIRVDPDGEAGYHERLAAFRSRIDKAMFGEDLVAILGGDLLDRLAHGGKLRDFLAGREYKDEPLARRLGGWAAAMQPLSGAPVVTYHRSWSYFLDRFGLELAGTVEEKPGIPPSARHRDEVTAAMKQRGARIILRESFYPPAIPDAIATDVGREVRVVELPLDIGGVDDAGDYVSLIDTIVERLAAACR